MIQFDVKLALARHFSRRLGLDQRYIDIRALGYDGFIGYPNRCGNCRQKLLTGLIF